MHQSTYGQRLAAARGFRGMTVTELSRESGVPRRQINRLERNEVDNPGINTSRKLAEALDTTIDYLAGRTDFDLPSFVKTEGNSLAEAGR